MTPPAPSEPLVRLAQRVGVATTFEDWTGVERTIAEDTLRAVLTTLGHDVGDDDAARASLLAHREREAERALPPTTVLQQGQTGTVRLGGAVVGEDVDAVVHPEDGGPAIALELTRIEATDTDGTDDTGDTAAGASDTGAALAVPASLPTGYHRLVLTSAGQTHEGHLIVVPAALELPDFLRDPATRATGVMTQLYAMRSRRSWGIGDLADLADLGTWAGDLGADFVLVNPLHASEPTAPIEPSPYLPTTRRFANPLYLRIEDIAEVGYLSAAERRVLEWHADDAQALNALDSIERDRVWALKDAALRVIHRHPRPLRRERAFQAYVEREGQGLLDYALWCALAVQHGADWSTWPQDLQDPDSAAVAVAREDLIDEIAYWCWLQWLMDEQVQQVGATIAAAGMRIGLMQDLAVGVHPTGADAWRLGDTLTRGVTVGAPPDQYNQVGQDWSQPPWHPARLEALGYAPFRAMVRTVLRGAGALRVDHVMGLFRLWWIPDGMPADQGTYVSYDHHAMVGILLLEAQRAGAVVVGEDLGTVEPWVRTFLAERGVFGTSILWFEYDGSQPREPQDYRRLCLATVTTHDLPPTAGYLAGVQVDLRAALGVLTRPAEEERAEVEKATATVLATVRRAGIEVDESDAAGTVAALHAYLWKTPAALIGVSVSDLALDRRIINQPGTSDEYPNWRVPLAGREGYPLPLEELLGMRSARRLARTALRGADR